MSVLNEDGAAATDDSDRQRCSCLPFGCLWAAGSGSGGPRPSGPAQAKRRRRRRLRFRLRLSSWLAWPWFRKSGGKGDAAGEGGGDGSSEKQGKRRGGRRRLLVLLTTSLQPKKALASVVSGDSSALLPLPVPVPAKVSSYGDAKKQSNRRPRRRATADDDAASGSQLPQASSATAATASTGSATAPAHARSRPETTTSQAPSPRPTDHGPAASGRRTWRAPSRRQRHSLRQPGDGDCSGSCGLWTAATTLGVIVFFGRVTAVVFLCSCLYGARFVRAWAAGGRRAGASAKARLRSGGVDDGVSSSSRRFGAPVGVVAGDDKVVAEMLLCDTEECKKKVIMAGLLDRAGNGKTPSSRFGR